MRVRMLTSRAETDETGRVCGFADVGDEIEIDDAQAELLIERGSAERVQKQRGAKPADEAVTRTVGAGRETR